MKYYSLNFVVAGEQTEDTVQKLHNTLNAMELVLNANGLGAELIMFTEVDQEWVDNIHNELNEADEEE